MKFCAIPEFHKQARTEPPLRDSLDENQQSDRTAPCWRSERPRRGTSLPSPPSISEVGARGLASRAGARQQCVRHARFAQLEAAVASAALGEWGGPVSNARSSRSSSSGRSLALRKRSVVESFACPRKSRTNTASVVLAMRLPAECRSPCRRNGRSSAAAQARLYLRRSADASIRRPHRLQRT
jgi:hypothetical protein